MTIDSSARQGVRSRIALSALGSPPVSLGALGATGGAGGEQNRSGFLRGTSRLLAVVRADHLLHGGRITKCCRVVGPGDDPRGLRVVGQCAVDGLGELLVVHDGVCAFTSDHLCQRGAGERGVQQQQIRADAVRRDDGLDEAAVIAAHDPDHPRLPAREGLQGGRERVAPLVDVAPGQGAQLVDEAGPIRASLRRGSKT